MKLFKKLTLPLMTTMTAVSFVALSSGCGTKDTNVDNPKDPENPKNPDNPSKPETPTSKTNKELANALNTIIEEKDKAIETAFGANKDIVLAAQQLMKQLRLVKLLIKLLKSLTRKIF
ncbi:hypothetical protein [Mycoplasmopsis adleri]|uniref:hypothetical protein n=1 Tax=Mycoplasmopsis adleri TaxID=51362 RepID=UPI003873C445